MRFRFTAAMLASGFLLVAAGPSLASCPIAWKAYTGPDGGEWYDGDNWNPSGTPSSTDDVCIPEDVGVIIWAGTCASGPNQGDPCDPEYPQGTCGLGYTCTDNQPDPAECAKLLVLTAGAGGDEGSVVASGRTTLNVYDHADVKGIVKVSTNATLDFKSTLTIGDGTNAASVQALAYGMVILRNNVTINSGSAMGVWATGGVLELGASLTVTGNGGKIRTDVPYSPPALIQSGTGGPYTLTLVGVNNNDPATSLVLRGNWDVNVPLVNNARVVADEATFKLLRSPVSGSGNWMGDEFSTDPGLLIVKVAVTGTAAWCLEDDADAKIRFETDSTGLDGDFELLTGTVQVGTATTNVDVSTSGMLTLVAPAKIQVVSGSTAAFDVN